MDFRNRATSLAIRLFRSQRIQRFLQRLESHVDLWRGYGTGAYVENSGESVLFDLVRERMPRASNAVIFDVGANVGDFSAAAFEALGPNVTIHAFEPAREVFEKLAARFAGNDHILLNNVALGHEVGDRALFGFNRDSGMASLLQRKLNDGETGVFQETIKVVRLSEYCAAQKIQRIDLLKLDVEGFELEVLLGAREIFDQKMVVVCSFEFGGCNLDSRTFLRDFFEFFKAQSLEIFRITPSATLVPLPHYHGTLEKFITTNYVAIRRDRRA